MVVFGVAEAQAKATGRVDVGEVTESYERTLRRVSVSGIQPPVFGLDVVRLGGEGDRALAVVVPPSANSPHLIYRGDYFGAPIRNHADTEWMRERQLTEWMRERQLTEWMRERQLEALYRLRLDARLISERPAGSL